MASLELIEAYFQKLTGGDSRWFNGQRTQAKGRCPTTIKKFNILYTRSNSFKYFIISLIESLVSLCILIILYVAKNFGIPLKGKGVSFVHIGLIVPLSIK